MFDSIEEAGRTLAGHAYLSDVGLSTSLFLALRMERALKPDNIFLVKVNYWLNL